MNIRAAVKTFINDEVIPAEPQLNAARGGEPLRELKDRAKAHGLWALGHPAELGGGGLSFGEFVLINEHIGRSTWGQLALGTVSMQDSIMLHRFGTDDQKKRWLEPLVAGDIMPSVGLTEPEVAGSDPTLIRATAHPDGDDWIVDAHKWFTTGASTAAFTTIFARTEPDGTDAHKALSAIVVPAGTPGFELVRVVPTMGSTHGDHCEIRLTGVRVPADHLLGERGGGFHVAQIRLGPGRIFHAMRWLGQAQRAFELMLDRARTRYAHGSTLGEKGEIQRYIAESAAEIQAARLLVLDAADAYDHDGRARDQIAIAKFWVARVLHDVIDRAIQVHGALGVTADTPLEAMYREARYARIYDGPDEVHRMTVARRLLADGRRAPWLRDTDD
ncbi:acyl-CoA dehydrogenase family protein [Cryptosporangium arvum]|uniref:acyl-CoA dehydrogenase family protein n=1 Tax=Cryptosporangium arvum TaxID=80871 RepID=UPI0004AF62A9|nr:acyl-CoA dehydrogenase family protein [Cryptosporangium arvum]